jgi:hypothetical protein
MGFTKLKQKKNYETKRNFSFDETKRNETKFRCFYCFTKQAKFRETIFCFALFCVSRNKKVCEMETLLRGTFVPVPISTHPNVQYLPTEEASYAPVFTSS